MVTTLYASNAHQKQRSAPLHHSPSELRVQRLRNIVAALQQADKQLQQQVHALTFESLSPSAMSGRRLQQSLDDRPPSPADRVRLGRELGNQYLRQYAPQRPNGAVNAPQRFSSVVEPQIASNTASAAWAAKAIQRGREFGNSVSKRNVSSGTRPAQPDGKPAASASSRVEEYGTYCRLRNRLAMLEQRRVQLMEMYGRDDFLDEYTELLERCWLYESTHANVEPFATAKIVRVLNAITAAQPMSTWTKRPGTW